MSDHTCPERHPDRPALQCTLPLGHQSQHEATNGRDTLYGWTSPFHPENSGPAMTITELQMQAARLIDPDAFLSENAFFYEHRYDQKVGESHSRAILWQGQRKAVAVERAGKVLTLTGEAVTGLVDDMGDPDPTWRAGVHTAVNYLKGAVV